MLVVLRKVDVGAWQVLVTRGGLDSYQNALRIYGYNVCKRAIRESKRIAEAERPSFMPGPVR